MAETLEHIVIGLKGFVFSVSAYVTAKGAGTFTDVGITEGGSELDYAEEATDIFGDQHLGPLLQEPNKRTCTLKVTMKEVHSDQMIHAFGGITASDRSGTTPAFTTEIDVDNVAQYKQLKLEAPGLSVAGLTAKKRTYTFWRARRSGPIKYVHKKDQPTMLEVTWTILQEITGTGTKSFYKFVES